MITLTASPSLLELAARATVLLSVALALVWVARHKSARVHHLLWTMTFAMLLGLPALNLLGPGWEVPVLPAHAPDTPGVQPAVDAPAVPISTETDPILSPPAPAQAATPPAPPVTEPSPSLPSIPLPLLLWGLGSTVALASLAVGRLRFGRLVRRAQPVQDPRWVLQVDTIRARLDVSRKVRVCLSTQAGTPMTGGWWRPAVLLPASAAEWSPGRRQAVLTHEMIHVRRRDALRQLLARVAVALYWFHPLAWLASWLAAAACEEACDEEVLALGTRPSEYAGHLLSVAGGVSPGPPVLALPMVLRSRPRLERRILSILEQRRTRSSAVATAIMLTAITSVGISAAVAHPVRTLSAGTVRIVENARPPDGSRLGWRIGPHPVTSIGGGVGGSAHMFTDATDATILRDGRIVVANRGTSELRVFDRSGTHVATWGGRGWGPGQFRDLFQVEPFSADTLVAWSWMAGWMRLLDSEGNFGRILREDQREASQLQLQRYFRQSTRGDTPILFGHTLAVELWDDLVIVSPTDRYEIRAFAADGTLARVVRRDHEPRAPTRVQVDAYVEAQVSRVPSEMATERTELRDDYESAPVAEHFPAFGTVMADVVDHLWVEEYAVPGEEMTGVLWTVFDPDGRALGFVETPRGLEIYEIGADYILGRVESELGVESVQVWPLERSRIARGKRE